MKIISSFIFFIFIFQPFNFSQDSEPELLKDDIILINEVFNFHSKLSKQIWKKWESTDAPFLFKRNDYDFLFNHPSPTDDFKSYFDDQLNKEVFYRENTDKNFYLAAYPAVNNIWTVVITKPDSTYNPYEWVLKTNHELFHIYQNTVNKERVINPFVNEYSEFHEMSFPFIYDNDTVNAALRVEAEILFNLITKDSISSSDVIVSKRVFNNIATLHKTLLNDSLQYKFKKWMEWNEGIAKYTEYKLAELAVENYFPTKEFQNLYDNYSYKKLWNDTYTGTINPVRFVGEGVKGRVMFYYSGLAKGLLLDKIYPGWRKHYFAFDIDTIIKEEPNYLDKCNITTD